MDKLVCNTLLMDDVDSGTSKATGDDENDRGIDFTRKLPTNVLWNILGQLEPEKLWRACQTNKALAAICHGQEFKRYYVQTNPQVMIDFITQALRLRKYRVKAGEAKLQAWFLIAIQEKLWNPAEQDNYAICWAARNGHLEVVKYLAVLPGVNLAAKDNHAIRMVASNGHLEVVKYLEGLPGVNPAAQDNDAIRMAAFQKHLEVVRYLLTLDRVRNLLYPAYLARYEAMLNQ